MITTSFYFSDLGEELPAVQLDDGTWYFSAQETCAFAEIASKVNAAKWVRTNIPAKWTQEIKVADGKGRPGLYLSKPGFYFAVCQGKSEQALKFRDLVFEDILVKIEASGNYPIPATASAPLKALMAADRKQKIEIANLEKKLERSETLVKRLTSDDQTIADFFYDCTEELRDRDEGAFCFAAELYAVYKHWIKKTKRIQPLSVDSWKQACIRRFSVENFDGSRFWGSRIRPQYKNIGYSAPSAGEFR